jgi:hypothetical protein
MRKKKGTYYLCRAYSSPNPSLPLSSLANSYCINFGTGSSDEPLGDGDAQKHLECTNWTSFTWEKNYTLSTQIFHLAPNPSHPLIYLARQLHKMTQVQFRKRLPLSHGVVPSGRSVQTPPPRSLPERKGTREYKSTHKPP